MFVVPWGAGASPAREDRRGQAPGLKGRVAAFRRLVGPPTTPLRVLAAYCHHAVITARSPEGLPLPGEFLRNQEYANAQLNRCSSRSRGRRLRPPAHRRRRAGEEMDTGGSREAPGGRDPSARCWQGQPPRFHRFDHPMISSSCCPTPASWRAALLLLAGPRAGLRHRFLRRSTREPTPTARCRRQSAAGMPRRASVARCSPPSPTCAADRDGHRCAWPALGRGATPTRSGREFPAGAARSHRDFRGHRQRRASTGAPSSGMARSGSPASRSASAACGCSRCPICFSSRTATATTGPTARRRSCSTASILSARATPSPTACAGARMAGLPGRHGIPGHVARLARPARRRHSA